MKLVIAEKPSVASTIAGAIGARARRDGWLEGSGYLVSWCIGHLAKLAAPEFYDKKLHIWKREDLPILPDPWAFTVSRDKWQQYAILRTLLKRTDVDEVINACDAGREGELIFRTVYGLTGCSKPVKRLWISSLEDEAIRKGFEEMKPGSEYDRLYAAALCRAKADWLVGINATRLFSTGYHRTLKIGRVMSPTLSLVVQRQAEINAFTPESFYTVRLDLDGMSAESEKFKEKEKAAALAEACQGQTAAVKAIVRKEHTENPPLLYNLTALQREANRHLGFTAQQTLDYLQSLYEKKLCTYPRTDSRFLTDDMVGRVPALLAVASRICEADVPTEPDTARVCSSRKVSDHYALIPTAKAGDADLSALPAGERKLLVMLSLQLLRAVSAPHKYLQTKVLLGCAGADFSVQGKKVLTPGWKIYAKMEDSELPELAEGKSFSVLKSELVEGRTAPPKHYTESTLLAAMEKAGSEDMPEDAERKGLGTPATRASVLEKLISTGFMERKASKKQMILCPTRIGVSLITILPEVLQSPLLTAEWEQKLKKIENGNLSEAEFMDAIAKLVQELVQDFAPVPGAEVLFPSNKEILGKCPRCGAPVTESRKGFFCERNSCRFALWKDNKYLTSKRISLTAPMVSALLKDGQVPVKNIYSERTGKSYNAVLTLTDDGVRSSYGLDLSRPRK